MADPRPLSTPCDCGLGLPHNLATHYFDPPPIRRWPQSCTTRPICGECHADHCWRCEGACGCTHPESNDPAIDDDMDSDVGKPHCWCCDCAECLAWEAQSGT